MSHFKVYYPECSQNEQNRINKKRLEKNEIIKEQILLAQIDRLPYFLQRLVGEFSPVVAEQRAMAKYEFFDTWINENTDRIMNDTFWIGVWPGLSLEMLNYMISSIHEVLGVKL